MMNAIKALGVIVLCVAAVVAAQRVIGTAKPKMPPRRGGGDWSDAGRFRRPAGAMPIGSPLNQGFRFAPPLATILGPFGAKPRTYYRKVSAAISHGIPTAIRRRTGRASSSLTARGGELPEDLWVYV